MSVAGRLLRDGWGLVLLVLGAFVLLHQTPGTAALVARQFVFLFAPAAAVVGCVRVVLIAPRGDERRAWMVLGVSLSLVLAGEIYFSVYQVVRSPAGPPAPSPYDWLNLSAALVLLVALVLVSGVRRLSLTTQLRIACDVLAMSVVGFVGLYAFWMNVLASSAPSWGVGAWWAGYSFMGVFVLLGVVWLARSTRSTHDREVVRLIAASLSIFALGIVTWPLWQSGDLGGNPAALSDAIDSSVVLLGYLLMMMAVWRRIALADRGWRMTLGLVSGNEAIGVSTVVSGVVLAGSIAMGVRAYTASESPQEMVFLATAASLAIMALVARTGFATAETGLLRGTSASDPVSGALNHRAFQEICEQRVLAAGRRRIPFAIAMLDLDGFDRVNVLLGHAQGDETLRTVASALALAGGRSSRAFRLSSDEFAVVGAGVSPAQATAFATSLLAAVVGIEPIPGMRLSASIGVVATESGTESREELVRRADAAQVWAKYHGKGRVVAYDAGIVRALGVEERLRLHEEQAYLSVARALAAAADTRDPSHRYHSRNVAALAVLLAEESGFDTRGVRAVEIAAMLHDVGRIAMPDDLHVAYRPGQQDSASEREHVDLGQQLVESIGVEHMGEWVRSHHEWWDGSGYPDGLAGEAIPAGARIIALADAYDGMTTGRRGGFRLSKGAALQEIDHGIGTRFDPVLAERFIEIVGRTASLGWADEVSAV